MPHSPDAWMPMQGCCWKEAETHVAVMWSCLLSGLYYKVGCCCFMLHAMIAVVLPRLRAQQQHCMRLGVT